MKNIKKILCVVIILAMVLCGCGQKRETRTDSASEQEQAKELCVFYTPDNEMLIKNFENLYPEYKLEKVIMIGNLEDELSRGRIPDLIIAEGSAPLNQWYKSGIIQDMGSYFGEDDSISDEDYFPGTLSVGREEGTLLALPLSARVPYMTVRQSAVEGTAFGNLSAEYTLEEYLNVLGEEFSNIPQTGSMVVSGIPFCYSFIDLLFATGAITLEEEKVEIDQSIFEKLYQICIENWRNYQEEAYVSMGVYRNAAVDPRDGEHIAAYWFNSPPQIGVLYAQSVNRQLLDEDIDVFWWPMAGESGKYAAEIATLGMISAECENPQAAYEVLRLMMDMPVKELIQPQRVDSMSVDMYMPVHIENAKDLCTYVETNGMTEFNVVSLSKEYEFVEKQAWDENLKEKVLNMLDGIQYVYRMDSSIYSELNSVAVYDYIEGLNVDGAADCYEEVVNYLQAKLYPAEPQHDGKYFSFSPAEYMEQLSETLETLDCTQYSIELDSGSSTYRSYNIIDTSKPEFLAYNFGSQIDFRNEDGYQIYDINTKEICGFTAYLNDTEYENLLKLMSAIIMTCDPSLDYKSAQGIIDMIPIYDTSKKYEEPGKRPSPYCYNGLEYSLEKFSKYQYFLDISVAAEE